MEDKWIVKALKITLQIVGNLRNIITLIILLRLLSLENIHIAAFIEAISGMALLATTPLQEDCDDN